MVCCCRYTTVVVDVGAENQVNNREVDVDSRRQSTVVNQAILQLRTITEKLKRAHIGQEVEWTDDSKILLFLTVLSLIVCVCYTHRMD
jgi:Glypican